MTAMAVLSNQLQLKKKLKMKTMLRHDLTESMFNKSTKSWRVQTSAKANDPAKFLLLALFH